jgi:hypothetical protein
VTVGAHSGRDSDSAWSFQTTEAPASGGGGGARPSDGVEGPAIIVRSQAGHEFTVTGSDLLMAWVVLLLFANTVLSVAEAFD